MLHVLVKDRHWQKHETFVAEYDCAAKEIDAQLVGCGPSRAQYFRWLRGGVKKLPYPDACRVLETMFPGYSAAELFASPATLIERAEPSSIASVDPTYTASALADVSAAFSSRADFLAQWPPHRLFANAERIQAAGLSLNLICQQFSDQRLQYLVEAGTTIECLFLDPDGESIKQREIEEGDPNGHLATLTRLNIEVMEQFRNRLRAQFRDRVLLSTYDEPIRFNIYLINDTLCVVQPYLPQARGINSPTFVVQRRDIANGLYPTFAGTYSALWKRGTPL